MIYHISLLLKNYYFLFNVAHYISFRAGAALFTAFGLTFLLGAKFISFSGSFFRAQAREYTPERHHQTKNNIPTMGGLLIIATTTLTTLMWCNWMDPKIWLVLAVLAGFGLLGGWDDWSKITTRKGISEKSKFLLQIIVAFLVSAGWYYLSEPDSSIWLPFFKNVHIELGFLFIFWSMFVLVASSNAVNLTDGLDGLAISSLIMNFATFGIISYVAGHYTFAHYLQIPFAQTAELAIVAAALVGASLGFLWFNAYPAQIFMGDVGALSLGGILGLIALMTKQESLLIISGGLFVVETLSVMLQVAIFKRWGRRFFKMAPLHHHFELIGWQEPKIMVRFGIITFLLCLLALLTLKLR